MNCACYAQLIIAHMRRYYHCGQDFQPVLTDDLPFAREAGVSRIPSCIKAIDRPGLSGKEWMQAEKHSWLEDTALQAKQITGQQLPSALESICHLLSSVVYAPRSMPLDLNLH